MSAQQPAARRGRRNPGLLKDQQQQQTMVGFPVPGDEDYAGGDEVDEYTTLLFEGETVTASISCPVTFEGMQRYSLAGGEAHCTVQPNEDGNDTAARARAAARTQFFAQIDEMEESLAAYAEQKAAEAAEMERQLNRR